MQFLTPGFFDLLVVLALIVGLSAAAIRIVSDFRRGPRWPEDTTSADDMDDANESFEEDAVSTGETTDD